MSHNNIQKTISIFLNSAGTLLLALASALFLINWTNPINLLPPHEPISLLSMREIFWIVSGIALVLALICLFAERPALPVLLLAWIAIIFFAYRIILFWNGCHSLIGFLGGFSYAFGISAHTADILIDIIFVYLFLGSCIALWTMRRSPLIFFSLNARKVGPKSL